MGCVIPPRKQKVEIAVPPSLKSSLLEKRSRSPNDVSGEVHFEDGAIRHSLQKETSLNSHSNEIKETLKRTNTPNFRKNVNYEPKFLEEDANKLNLDDSDEEKGQKKSKGQKNHKDNESTKKTLMKVPTFSRNITNQANNRKDIPKANTFVVESPEIVQQPFDDNMKDDRDALTAKSQGFFSGQQGQVQGQNPQRTRFFPTGKHKDNTSPKDLNQIPLKTNNSTGSNSDSKSPTNNKGEKVSSFTKIEGKSPKNQQKSFDAMDSHKSLDKICEEESELASPEKKKSKKQSIMNSSPNNNSINNNNPSTKRNSPLSNSNEQKEIKFPNAANSMSSAFKTNLIDLFRNENNSNVNNNSMNFQNNIKSGSNLNNNNTNNAVSSSVFNKNSKKNIVSPQKNSFQSISSINEINSNHIIGPEPQEFDKKKQNPNKFFHINPNANLISMFKNEQEQNVCEDDNHNFLTIDDDGPSPINRPPLFQNDLEPDRETSLNISTFENASNDVTNSNMEKSEINRTTIHNPDEISKDLSKYSINAECYNVEYDDKKGLKDHSPSNGNILSGLNSPINNHQNGQFSNQKTLGFSGIKSSKTHKPPQTSEEKKFLSPTVKKKKQLGGSRDKFKLRSLTMKEIEDSGGEEEKQSPKTAKETKENNKNSDNNENNENNNKNIRMTSSTMVSPLFKKTENANKLDTSNRLDISNRMPKSPASMASAKLKRAKTTLEAENSVVHTSKLDITKDEQGNKKINQYLMIKDLGKGGFGKVKLALNETDKKHYAIKIANKKKLKKKLLSRSTSVYTLLEKEVATMKKLSHPNIVQLYEVIDDSGADKLYLVMEFMKKGAILSKNYFKYEEKTYNENEDIGFNSMVQQQELQERKTLTYEKAKKYFRDFLLGLDYLHSYVNVIHRDIKPENLLIDEEDNLKIADFGVSTIMENGDDQLANNAGTKAFLAPETWDGKPFKGKKTDVWAACATLYFLVMGKLPFQAANAEDLRKKIQEDQPEFPADMPSSLQDLIRKGLEKNPEKRITVPMMMNHPWVTDNGLNPLENYLEEDVFEVSEKEIKNAMTKMSFRASIMLTYRLKKNLNRTRSRIMQRKARFFLNNFNKLIDLLH